MDENTVRRWLKDHKNDMEKLVHQQATASQSKYEALRSELRETFEESVKNCFGPSKYEDPQGALSKPLHLGTVEEYQREFEKELLVSRPASFGDVFTLARITEARLEDQTTPTTGTITKPATSLGTQKPAVPRLRGSSTLGLCFNCDNRWTRGHKFLGKFLLLMTEEEDDMRVATGDGGEDAFKSGDISILNSFIGHGSPCSLQLWGKISKGDVHVLIDNGSTHNFIRPDVVEKMCLPIKSTKAFKVYIGSGESLLCESKVTHDYAHQTMEFTLLDTTYSLKGDDSLRMKKISLHQMQAMLEHDDVYGVYEEHQFYVRKTKCVFGAKMLEYLGHMISGRGVEMDPEKVIAVLDWPEPTTQSQDGFRWGDQEAAAFRELKQQFSTTPILSLPDFTQEFIVEDDASDYGIGVVLHQQLDRWSGLDGFRREQGLLIFCNRYYVHMKSKLKALLLCEFHDTPSVGHGGMKKMLVGLSALFYWRGMRKSMEDYINKCTVCQQTKYSTQVVGGYLSTFTDARKSMGG
ncbi:ty3-gypsy retrotransposon protein [Tanacetum coccineum]